MARAADSYLALNIIDERANKTAYRDDNNDPLDHAPLIVVGNDVSGAIEPFNWALMFIQAAPATSGTRYTRLVKGTLAIDIVNGKIYIKTTAAGAADNWAVVGAQT